MKSIDNMKSWLLEVNDFVKDLVPEIRAQAFDLLASASGQVVERSDPTADDSASLSEFFEGKDNLKPSDAALRIAAYWFSQYGSAPFTKAWAEETASRVGLTIPTRVDMTYRQARRGGKNLFRVSKAGHTLTVHGESFLRQQFNVEKGTKAPPNEEAA